MTATILENPETVNIERTRIMQEAVARAENIKNDEPQRFPDAASVGDAVRQGDIYIQLIDDVAEAPLFYRADADPVFPMQLAPGNTKGSRHCLAHGNGVTVYQPVAEQSDEMYLDVAKQHKITAPSTDELVQKIREKQWALRDERNGASVPSHVTDAEAIAMLALAGPIFVLHQENKVAHPEHGDWILPPGSYRVTYQRTVTRENAITRVLD